MWPHVAENTRTSYLPKFLCIVFTGAPSAYSVPIVATVPFLAKYLSILAVGREQMAHAAGVPRPAMAGGWLCQDIENKCPQRPLIPVVMQRQSCFAGTFLLELRQAQVTDIPGTCDTRRVFFGRRADIKAGHLPSGMHFVDEDLPGLSEALNGVRAIHSGARTAQKIVTRDHAAESDAYRLVAVETPNRDRVSGTGLGTRRACPGGVMRGHALHLLFLPTVPTDDHDLDILLGLNG
jgi:hypothetical protein